MTTLPADILAANILVVDDQEANVTLLQQMLREAGYTRVSATMKPREVCALHRRNAYDLILLDLQMPGMDGFEVMEGLKANPADPYLPVLVITAQPGHKVRALQAGAKDFISKPLDLVEARARIHNLLEMRLLHRRLEGQKVLLEREVLARTAELRESEARYRALTELASDWYWEQDLDGKFTKLSGPVLEMMGLRVDDLAGTQAAAPEAGWDPAERASLQARIASREAFLDVLFHRVDANGARRQFRVSGEPMFDRRSVLIGYRGIGVEVTAGM